MSDSQSPVDAWLQPLGGSPCGEDLEYDLSFLEFNQAAAGKPETQFAPAEPPQWSLVIDLAQQLFERTRDLRVAVPWARAQVVTGGLVELAEALRLFTGLLENFWDSLHPVPDPDDGDPFARINALGALAALDGLLGDARNAPLMPVRSLGGLRARDIEAMLDKIPLRADDTPVSPAQVTGVLLDSPEALARLKVTVPAALEHLKALQRLMNDRFGIERAVDVKPLRSLLEAVQSVLPEAAGEAASDSGSGQAEGDGSSDGEGGPRAAGAARRGAGPMSVDSRADALKAIGLVCAYLERAEPTNPAQLLLRRAERLIGRSFLELIRELAPDSINEVARVMGVDPDSVQRPDY